MVLLARTPSVPTFSAIPDAQARALLHGHWNMPLRSLAIEAFDIHGRYYTYFGLWPSILRMPILLVTHHFDGHLTAPSMLLALVVTLVSTARLHWSLRKIMRPDAPLGRGETLSVAAIQLLVGAGSVVIFLGSRPLVYHEMEIWGVATGLLTADYLCRYAMRPSIGRAVLVGVAATIAAMSRPSVGFGAIAAAGLLALVELIQLVGSRRRPNHDDSAAHGSWSRLLALAGTGVVLPAAVYGAINEARFGTLFSLPLNRQVFTFVDRQRQITLAANGDSLFGAKFAPTTLFQYARPDALRFTSRYPFVDFPLHRAHVFGHVIFDTLDRSSSVTASMPGLLLLAIVGTVFLIRRRGLLARAVAPAAIGLTAGTVFVITIAFVTNRYLADIVPPLVLLALVGVQGVASMRPLNSRAGRTGVVAIVVLCAFGAWASFGLAVVYQRDLQPNDPGYGRGTGTSAAAPAPAVAPARRDLKASAAQTAPTAARITIDGSAVARRRV
ncbi:MAG TPA: hypothetical protein VGI86_10745 [Acidimicrobiia bacterium]